MNIMTIFCIFFLHGILMKNYGLSFLENEILSLNEIWKWIIGLLLLFC